MKIIKCVIFLASFVFLINCWAIGKPQAEDVEKEFTPDDCKNIVCVRDNIDQIDSDIVKLLGKRMAFVKRARQLKLENQSLHDQARETQILHSVAKQANKAGFPGAMAVAIFKEILRQANIYEIQKAFSND